jgi:hypothetical protein
MKKFDNKHQEIIFKYNRKDFHKHMREKRVYWDPLKIFFGDDFVVFEFEFMFEHDNAITGAQYWLKSYNYDLHSDGKQRFVVVNKSTVAESETKKPDPKETEKK